MATILRAFMIGFIIAGMLFSGMSIFMSEIADNYGVALDGNMSASYNDLGIALNDTTDMVYSMQNSTEGGEGITSSESTDLVSISPTIWGVIKMPFKTLLNFNTVLSTITSEMHLPSWFFTGIAAIIMLILTLIILSILFRWDI